MTEAEIKAVVFKLLRKIAPEADPASLAPHERLRAALEIDSFDFLNLMIGLKNELGVEIPESDYGQLSTLVELVHYLQTRIGVTPP